VSFGNSNITYPYVQSGASANYPNQGFYSSSFFGQTWTVPGTVGSDTGNHISGIHQLLNIYSGSVSNVGQYYFVNKPDQLTYNDIQAGEELRIMDYRQNMFNLFLKDDWKVSDSLTLNLGVRYEWYGVPSWGTA
jgi:outer membrane receptor protein involved in Fe transport